MIGRTNSVSGNVSGIVSGETEAYVAYTAIFVPSAEICVIEEASDE